jgi:hypothetical protein
MTACGPAAVVPPGRISSIVTARRPTTGLGRSVGLPRTHSTVPDVRGHALCGRHHRPAAGADYEDNLASVGMHRQQLAGLAPRLLLLAAWDSTVAPGAALLWRPRPSSTYPVVRVLPNGTYLTARITPTIRGRRRECVLAAARAGGDLSDINTVPDGAVTLARRTQASPSTAPGQTASTSSANAVASRCPGSMSVASS